MGEPLRVGMLGYRFMGRAHSNAIARLPMFFPDAPPVKRELLIGRNEDALAQAAEQFGFTRTTTQWENAIDEVDVLYNLGPNHLHAEPSIVALQNGLHVFCEKPLADTLEAGERMVGAARNARGIAGIAFNYRFVPAIRYAKRLIDDGMLGEIHHVRTHYLQDWLVDPDAPWSWRNAEELAGSGALGDLGSHIIDLARFLIHDTAGPITAVSGALRTFVEERPSPSGEGHHPVTVDDAFSAQAAFDSGAMGTFEASRVASGAKNDLTITVNGGRGSLRFELERLNELQITFEDARGFETILVTESTDPYIDHWWPPGHVIGWEHTFVHENYEFLTSVAKGETHRPSFEDGFRVQQILHAIERADEAREWVTIA